MIKIGGFIPQGWIGDLSRTDNPGEQYRQARAVAKLYEELGYDSGFLYDHFHPIDVKEAEKQPVWECWATLSALAEATEKLRLGQLVTCNMYRQPSLLAKIASTVDALSNGRLEFGIGAGWYEAEFRGYGYTFPSAAARIRMLEEAVTLIKRLWAEDNVTFDGRYYHLKNAFCAPKPVQKPYPPILIGGAGEKLTLGVVAKHADRCELGMGVEQYRRKLDVLRAHCQRVGRRFDEIERCVSVNVIIEQEEKEVQETLNCLYEFYREPGQSKEGFLKGLYWVIAGTPSSVLEQLLPYRQLEVTFFIVNFMLHFYAKRRDEPIRAFAKEVASELRGS